MSDKKPTRQKKDGTPYKSPVRRVFGRVKGAVEAADGALQQMVFELRKDGIYLRNKHGRKWRRVDFAALVAEQARQAAEEAERARAKREDPNQLALFAVEPPAECVQRLVEFALKG